MAGLAVDEGDVEAVDMENLGEEHHRLYVALFARVRHANRVWFRIDK